MKTEPVEDLKKLMQKVLEKNGMNLNQYKTSFLERRFKARMSVMKINTYSEYEKILDRDTSEYKRLLENFSINVTEFFRDGDVFDAFSKSIIPKLLEQKKTRTIRVWSAGCATGEEVYSIAILLYEALKDSNHTFKVIGTDININAINVAKLGKYPESAVNKMSKNYLSKYFDGVGDGHYQVKKELKDYVQFNLGNLESIVSPKFLDVIFCRNFLIYVEKTMQQKLFTKFYDSLVPYGFLVIGKSEVILGDILQLFEAIMRRERIYQKQPKNYG